MRALVLVTIEALIAFAFTATIPVEKRGPGYLKFPVSANSQSSANLTNKRRSFEADTYYNWDTYTLLATVGTPGDYLAFELQTANWFSWVNPMCTYAYDVEECQEVGFYDYDSSRTSGEAGGSFFFNFNEGTSTESVVEGNWVYDTWVVEGTPISGIEFGMVSESYGASMHAFGLGCSYLCGGTLPSALDWIYMTDLIESQAFSLDLGSVDPGDGSIIFGGIDIKKYSGALQKVPWVPMSKRVWEGASDFDPKYYVGLIVVGVTFPPSSGKSNGKSYLGNLPYYLDNAVPTHLDIGLYNTIAGWFADQKEGNSFDCSIRNERGTIDFYFGTDAGITAVIHVPFSEWFTHLESGICTFDASPATSGPPGSFSLGPSFMRSAFLVFDQVNRNVLMAQAVYCGEEIVPIGSGPDAVPSMTGLCDPPFSATPTSSHSSAKISSTSKSLSTSSSTHKTTTTSSSSSSKSSSTSKPSTSTLRITTASSPSSSKSTSTSKPSTSTVKISTTSSPSSSKSSSTSNKQSTSTSTLKTATTSTTSSSKSTSTSKTSSSSGSTQKITTTSSRPSTTSSSTSKKSSTTTH